MGGKEGDITCVTGSDGALIPGICAAQTIRWRVVPTSYSWATLQDISAAAARRLYTGALNALPDGPENRVVGG